jgi:MHS family citrate/tricarballylate:H+ symporter-like MFS transporter
MWTFGGFALGFFMRPLGAIILGAYIDKVGRRKGLIVTLSIMASGTILIAFVPGYATIGMLAPVLVLVGRLLQGFSAGAELGGVSVYLAEMATPGHRGFYTSWQSASQQVAIVAAAALGFAVNHWLAADEITAWGWRIPFFVGCAIVPLIFVLRRSLLETEEFLARKHHPEASEVFRTIWVHRAVVLEGMLLVAMTTTTFYLITVYTPTFGTVVLKLTAADSLIVTLCVGLTNFCWLPVGGALSDRIGRRPLLIAITSLAILTAYPLLSWLVSEPSFQRLLLVLLLFSFYFGMYNGAMVVTLTEVMPPQVRVAGFSLAFSLATAVFGGVTPIVSTFLIKTTGDRAAPAYWMTFAAACSLVATLLLLRRARRERAT